MLLMTISSEYLPTTKNQMVKDIYEKMGFLRTGNNTFELNVSDFTELKTYIKEKN